MALPVLAHPQQNLLTGRDPARLMIRNMAREAINKIFSGVTINS